MTLPDWYLEKRRLVEELFDRRPEVERPETSDSSPSGRFRLVLTSFPDPEKKSWAYSRGRVFEGDRLIADVRRNFGAFPFAWVETHPTNHQTYLICGEDYQGQTVINCDTRQRRESIEAQAGKGWGFCWAKIHPNPRDPSLIAVEGCVWACPYELHFVRLHVDGQLETIAKVDVGQVDFLGWDSNGRRARFKYELEVETTTGKPEAELPRDVQDALEAFYDRCNGLTLPQIKELKAAEFAHLPDFEDRTFEESWDVAEKFGIVFG